MRIQTLDGASLNFWVAKSMSLKPVADGRGEGTISVIDPASGKPEPYQPTIDWSQAGPIIAEQWDDLETTLLDWLGPHWPHLKAFRDHPLIWLMRAFVALRFGDEVDDRSDFEEG